MPDVHPIAALEKFTLVTRNCAEPGATAGNMSVRESLANGAVVVTTTLTDAAPARSGSVTVMLKGSAAGGAADGAAVA